MFINPTHALFGAQLRFNRADKHLGEVDRIVQAFSRSCEQRLTTRYDPNSGSHHVFVPELPPVPPELSVVVGDAIQNLRAALDYIIFELAIIDSGRAQDGTQFLIEDRRFDARNKHRGFDGHKSRCLRGLSPRHIDAVEELQPYRGVTWTKDLRDLSNPDKHRQLSVLVGSDFYTMWVFPSGQSREPKGVVFTNVGLDDKEFSIDARQSIQVAPSDASKPALIPRLRQIELEVCATIERFAGEFR